jgi:hypothetical protein
MEELLSPVSFRGTCRSSTRRVRPNSKKLHLWLDQSWGRSHPPISYHRGRIPLRGVGHRGQRHYQVVELLHGQEIRFRGGKVYAYEGLSEAPQRPSEDKGTYILITEFLDSVTGACNARGKDFRNEVRTGEAWLPNSSSPSSASSRGGIAVKRPFSGSGVQGLHGEGYLPRLLFPPSPRPAAWSEPERPRRVHPLR